jgi:catechol 2,3-dioxygenase-like lactoylglutathione lyase family enzyme
VAILLRVRPKTLDHVAFWVADRDRIADFAVRHLGMHVIDRQDTFTLIGADARHGKLTLFDAEGPREPGAFHHVGLRVSNLAAARRRLPATAVGEVFEIGDGIRVTLVEHPTDVEYDLDHVALVAVRPDATAREYRRYGFEPAVARDDGLPRVEVGGAFVEFHAGDPGNPERPLLNHIAVLVDSADEHVEEANALGIEVESVVDAPNTYAAFLRGPEGVRIEYVEHKPTFSLA